MKRKKIKQPWKLMGSKVHAKSFERRLEAYTRLGEVGKKPILKASL